MTGVGDDFMKGFRWIFDGFQRLNPILGMLSVIRFVRSTASLICAYRHPRRSLIECERLLGIPRFLEFCTDTPLFRNASEGVPEVPLQRVALLQRWLCRRLTGLAWLATLPASILAPPPAMNSLMIWLSMIRFCCAWSVRLNDETPLEYSSLLIFLPNLLASFVPRRMYGIPFEALTMAFCL